MAILFLLVVVVWIIFSMAWDGRKRNREKMLEEMKDSYTKQETLDLLLAMKREAFIPFLAQGLLLGIAFLGVMR
jgi:DNA repair protein RadC